MLGHDLSYLLDVLNITAGETEDQLDERLRTEAREAGVDIVEEQGLHDNPSFTLYLPEYPRRSASTDSRASQSTGLTFTTFSDLSKDRDTYHEQRRPSHVSLSFRDYDAFLARGVPNGRHSISFSPRATPSQSTFSLPLSHPPSPDLSPRKNFRRIRGLSMLRLHRNDSGVSLADGCPHCPQDFASQRRARHRLPCGHRLCTQSLRNVVRTATESSTGSVPSCCGKPIPGSLVEHVMTQEEQTALLLKLEQWDDAISLAPSIGSSRCDSLTPPSVQQSLGPMNPDGRNSSEDTKPEGLSAKDRKELEMVIGREDYKLVRAGQGEQRDRFLKWVGRERAELKSEHETARDEIKRKHEAAVEDRVEQHASAITEAEDKQVKAEADMREAHAQERRDSATALKHIEAYCAGTFSTGEPNNRTITEKDLSELDKAWRARDQMDRKHLGQINVLRGEQGRRMRLREQRQDRELQELMRQQRKEELELERMLTGEMSQLDESITCKRKKLQWRWELQMAIFAKTVVTETGILLQCRLPITEWELGPIAK